MNNYTKIMNNIKTLTNGQRARITGSNHQQHIQIGHTMTQLLKDFTPDRAEKIANNENNKHVPAYGIALSTCLTADYEGKQADLAADRAAHNAAPLIEQGELVIIEGEYFTAKISDRRVSDPLKFVRAEAPEPEAITIWTASQALNIDNLLTPTGKKLNILDLVTDGNDFLQTPCIIQDGQLVVGSICYTDADADTKEAGAHAMNEEMKRADEASTACPPPSYYGDTPAPTDPRNVENLTNILCRNLLGERAPFSIYNGHAQTIPAGSKCTRGKLSIVAGLAKTGKHAAALYKENTPATTRRYFSAILDYINGDRDTLPERNDKFETGTTEDGRTYHTPHTFPTND